MTQNAERFNCSLDKDIILQLITEANRRGQSKSYYVAKCLKIAMAMDSNLTIAERYRWNMSIIEDRINNLFNSIHVKFEGSILKSIVLIYSIPIDFYDTENQYKMVKTSIFEILEHLRTVDENLFRRILEILKSMNEFGNSENSEILPPCTGKNIDTISVTEFEEVKNE